MARKPARSDEQPAVTAAVWPRPAKVAFIGSHGVRKTTALLAFAAEVQRAGRSVELAREVVRDNPLGINEGATGEAQLWVLVSQVRQELELARKADVLVTDRGVMDNYAYYLRACRGSGCAGRGTASSGPAAGGTPTPPPPGPAAERTSSGSSRWFGGGRGRTTSSSGCSRTSPSRPTASARPTTRSETRSRRSST